MRWRLGSTHRAPCGARAGPALDARHSLKLTRTPPPPTPYCRYSHYSPSTAEMSTRARLTGPVSRRALRKPTGQQAGEIEKHIEFLREEITPISLSGHVGHRLHELQHAPPEDSLAASLIRYGPL
ncbi:jg22806 [Pararge aegeria aegeria]|uniref:Jg22806 protein n=1 Tax=Pararge aegeria aegeria TaxID=348720 RepID=A0A8S4RYB1_9NEOP|nr:jg22806 [Pararge aegeria aegeria]